MITPADVRRCVAARWRLTPAARTSLPGGLWHGRVPDGTAAPYAQMTAALRETHSLGRTRYTRAFEVRVSAWADVGGAVDPGAVERALGVVLDFSPGTALVVPGGRVVACRPLEWDEDLDESLRNSLDVCVSRAAWRLVAEGTR